MFVYFQFSSHAKVKFNINFLSLTMKLPDLKDAEAVQKFFLEEIQLGEELLAQGETTIHTLNTPHSYTRLHVLTRVRPESSDLVRNKSLDCCFYVPTYLQGDIDYTHKFHFLGSPQHVKIKVQRLLWL